MNSSIAQASSSISPAELQRLRQGGATCDLLDVRTPPEHASAHVAGVQLVPLDDLDPAAFLQRRSTSAGPLYVICQSGARAARAIEKFRSAGFNDCILVEGGTQGWIDAGLPVERGISKVIPLMRQVQIAVGFISAVGAVLALTVDYRFAILPLFIGCGLVFAGVTGTCGMALLIARMPWNRQTTAPNSCARV
jgi:rhodanese-related sulfurtransferase